MLPSLKWIARKNMKAKMFNINFWVKETRPDVLVAKYEKMLHDAGFHVLKRAEQFFAPFGFTCVWVLGESHLAVHTFPEEEKTYIELSSCVEDYFYKFNDLIDTNEVIVNE